MQEGTPCLRLWVHAVRLQSLPAGDSQALCSISRMANPFAVRAQRPRVPTRRHTFRHGRRARRILQLCQPVRNGVGGNCAP